MRSCCAPSAEVEEVCINDLLEPQYNVLGCNE